MIGVFILERGIIRQALMATKQQDWLPVISLLLGATMWGVVWYPMRLLEQAGVSGLWQALGIDIPPALLMSWALYRHRDHLRRYGWQLFGLAVASWWTNTAFILAILDGNVMRVLLLFYLSPVWTVILGVWLLKERLSTQSIITLVCALVGGSLMLVKPAAITSSPITTADWMALSAGVAFSFYNLLTRMAQHAPVSLKGDVAWFGVVAGSIGAIVVTGEPSPALNAATILGVIAVGVFGILFMTLFVQYGVTHMPVQRSAVILLFELVAGAISQQLLTDEQLLLQEWVGGVLIVTAAFLATRLPADHLAGNEHRNPRQAE